jgi:reprolysin-like metallo-peptidase family M12B/Calx-beta domain-containing protein
VVLTGSLAYKIPLSSYPLTIKVDEMNKKFPPTRTFRKLIFLLLLPLFVVLTISDWRRIERRVEARTAFADNPWRTIDERQLSVQVHEVVRPRSYRTLTLDRDHLKRILSSAPKEFITMQRESSTQLSLPLADGSFADFRVVDSPIMEPALAARFPEIKTYSAQSTTNPSITGRIDWTTFGFHGIIFSPQGTMLIEPYAHGDTATYISYFQGDMPAAAFDCDVSEGEKEAAAALNKVTKTLAPKVTSGGTLRTYRLAVGVTGEYTQTYGAGTVSGALSAVTTTVNLVNAVYERDVAIRFVLIANETDIIYTDAVTDGYTSDNVNSLIAENQTKLDSVIGTANYDIGHVYDGRALGGGFSFQGLATIGSACRLGLKARGVSISRSVPPSSVIAYYSNSHELGHQFNATHTFNANSGNCFSARTGSSAYEPGTGTTILGYRFNCAPEDFMSSDTYFHVNSLDQIVTYSTIGLGSGCPVAFSNGNNAPAIDAGPSYTIPRSTPFILIAIGNDVDGETLTYTWEQFDLGAAAPPDTDDGSRPIFRSFAPAANPSRTFPRLTDILNNTTTFGESLPVTTRALNFRVTARDNHTAGGGINSAATVINVTADSGPFSVTQPASGTNWTTNSLRSVTWNVANTNASPVSCSSVRILLSTDGGNTFPIVLANDTANDGSELVTTPGATSSTARIKVAANGNVFFNISPQFIVSGVNNTVPAITGFSPGNGPIGTSVTITGVNFISPSAVNFNGVTSSFVVNSTTEIVAVVPAGAATGLISVTTPSGTANSSSSFTVNPSQLQFSAANYVVNEGGGFATITVNRTGDTSTTATVDFATSDGSSALQRTDYTIAGGTLTFAPGDTSQTFQVLISDDAFVEGTETFNLSLTSPTIATLGAVSTATVTINDNDSSGPVSNPIDDPRYFVQQHYFDFLSRYPDSGGWDFWTNSITACGTDQACVRTKRIDVSNAFYYELEFQQTGSYVYRLYRIAFGNNQPFPNPNADPANPGEEKKVPLYLSFMQDRARVRGGAQLAQFQLALANSFAQRPEFTNKYASALSGPSFVDALLANIQSLGVNLSSQRQALIDLFNSGGRGNVLYRLADDNAQTNPINNRALIDAEYNRAFVFTQYAGYLRRDADMGGFLFWLGQVNGAPLRDVARQHAMVCSFITSTEYQQRFSSVVTHGNSECQ